MLSTLQIMTMPHRKPAAMSAPVTPRPKRQLRSRAWWCMRAMPSFSADDLMLTVATGQEHAARNNLVRFIAALESAAILTRLPNVGRRVQPDRWTLTNDLGPLTPVVRRGLNQISDPNTGALIDYITREVPKC